MNDLIEDIDINISEIISIKSENDQLYQKNKLLEEQFSNLKKENETIQNNLESMNHQVKKNQGKNIISHSII